MAMQDEIRELTVNLLQSTVDASLVTAVCVGTEQILTRRLRSDQSLSRLYQITPRNHRTHGNIPRRVGEVTHRFLIHHRAGRPAALLGFSFDLLVIC